MPEQRCDDTFPRTVAPANLLLDSKARAVPPKRYKHKSRCFVVTFQLATDARNCARGLVSG